MATNSASGGLSSSRGAALKKDHSGLNKFIAPDDEAFVEICRAIECHRNGARGQKYLQKIERPGTALQRSHIHDVLPNRSFEVRC